MTVAPTLDVCYLRLDFETFEILGVDPARSDEDGSLMPNGYVCRDTFDVTVRTAFSLILIC